MPKTYDPRPRITGPRLRYPVHRTMHRRPGSESPVCHTIRMSDSPPAFRRSRYSPVASLTKSVSSFPLVCARSPMAIARYPRPAKPHLSISALGQASPHGDPHRLAYSNCPDSLLQITHPESRPLALHPTRTNSSHVLRSSQTNARQGLLRMLHTRTPK
ncbi:hypothetical protein DENSPDRAFT_400239 [Dentipellis sp. KUC8613]|nr:hypothetical protein DENSPDRAFT_400239 [Dentipellis sp. KUC8613]